MTMITTGIAMIMPAMGIATMTTIIMAAVGAVEKKEKEEAFASSF